MPEYEFTKEQNQSIKSLTLHIRITAILLALYALSWLMPISSMISDTGFATLFKTPQLYSMIVFLIMAYLAWRVSPHLQRIIDTQGKDISELLDGLRALGTLNHVGRILLVIGSLLLIFRLAL